MNQKLPTPPRRGASSALLAVVSSLVGLVSVLALFILVAYVGGVWARWLMRAFLAGWALGA
ncbi:hypothetical protein [Cupriavidus taiwanensis]|uniref:hypothetical protein n=1 Tax=Cupriavidus taiwanensis TaxID=164546 RepID=UPI000E18DA00|nr:hypothetical protein [Cupriavidus taiwanensis]SPA17208.1 exported hypothetical protein [Cupriavidus taiwanensis]